MKVEITPQAHPDAINLEYFAEAQFKDHQRIVMCQVTAIYKPDEQDPLMAPRVHVRAEVLDNMPLGTEEDKLVATLEQIGNVFTPAQIQFWPQYLEQPAEVRRMPKMGLLLQKVKKDCLDLFDAFMKDMNEFHAYYTSEPDSEITDEGEPDIAKLPEFVCSDGRMLLSRLYWMDAAHTDLWCECYQDGTFEERKYALKDFGVDTLASLTDMIQGWNEFIKTNN